MEYPSGKVLCLCVKIALKVNPPGYLTKPEPFSKIAVVVVSLQNQTVNQKIIISWLFNFPRSHTALMPLSPI